MSELFSRLLQVRGIDEAFLHPKYEELIDLGCLPDLKVAVKRLKQAVKKQEKVLIYGDYDVDGVTASALMYEALRLAGLEVMEIMLPDRFVDGYGMSEKVVERAREGGFSLVVTVDCGSRDVEIVKKLKKAGIDTIITDHHELGPEFPPAVAVVNPKREKEGDLWELAGVGVAFKVAQALVAVGLINPGQEKWLLDLVVIGTICDSMLLIGENRRLTYYGMLVLKRTRRVGLKELMRVAGVKRLNASAIGFQIGPRLNAAGRMESAKKALKLLMTENRTEAAALAEELNQLNSARRAEQVGALKEIMERGVGSDAVLVEVGSWHEGVLGIIAGRLMEVYKRPTFVLAPNGELLKGSGRSFGEFNLAEALSECQNEIVSGGGHSSACGVKVLMEKVESFKLALNQYYKSLRLGDQRKFLMQKEDLVVGRLGDLTLELMEELRVLEPYGVGNEEPVFLLTNITAVGVRRMGAEGNHLGLMVRDREGKTLKLVAFSAPKQWLNLEVGANLEAFVRLEENEWNQLRSVEGRIIKLNLVE